MSNSHLEEEQKSHQHGHALRLIIEGKDYEWYQQYITGTEIRKLGNIPPDNMILLAIQRPWEDEVIDNDTRVDLARPGIEHFHIRKHGEGILVSININDIEYKVKRGKYPVLELKKIGGVPQGNELDELIDGKLVPLNDTATILIKGCEQFFSHVRDGSSS